MLLILNKYQGNVSSFVPCGFHILKAFERHGARVLIRILIFHVPQLLKSISWSSSRQFLKLISYIIFSVLIDCFSVEINAFYVRFVFNLSYASYYFLRP